MTLTLSSGEAAYRRVSPHASGSIVRHAGPGEAALEMRVAVDPLYRARPEAYSGSSGTTLLLSFGHHMLETAP